MTNADIEKIYDSLIDELTVLEGKMSIQDKLFISERILAYVFNLESPMYCRNQDILDKHLCHLRIPELKYLYFISLSDSNKRTILERNEALKRIIDINCRHLLPDPTKPIMIEEPIDCNFLDDAYSNCTFRFCPPIWIINPCSHRYNYDDSEIADIIIGDLSLILRHNGELRRATKNNSLYLGIGQIGNRSRTNKYEAYSINSEISIFQSRDDILAVILPREDPIYPIVKMVDISSDKNKSLDILPIAG